MEELRHFVHFSGHVFVPLFISWTFFRANWKKAFLIMLLTIVVDVDHLWANPIFDPSRCSIGYHFLHRPIPIILYCIAAFYKPTRIVGIGLVLHMITDGIDCLMMQL